MALVNCERCGRVFDSGKAGESLCKECIIEEQKDLKKINDYLRKNPMANIMEASKDTGIARGKILRLIKGGSLKMRKPMEEHKCRICGKIIKAGTICDECRVKIEGGIKGKNRKNR